MGEYLRLGDFRQRKLYTHMCSSCYFNGTYVPLPQTPLPRPQDETPFGLTSLTLVWVDTCSYL